jgi:hypothetical protein
MQDFAPFTLQLLGGLGGPQTPGLLFLKVLKALDLGQSLIMHIQNTYMYCSLHLINVHIKKIQIAILLFKNRFTI